MGIMVYSLLWVLQDLKIINRMSLSGDVVSWVTRRVESLKFETLNLETLDIESLHPSTETECIVQLCVFFSCRPHSTSEGESVRPRETVKRLWGGY